MRPEEFQRPVPGMVMVPVKVGEALGAREDKSWSPVLEPDKVVMPNLDLIVAAVSSPVLEPLKERLGTFPNPTIADVMPETVPVKVGLANIVVLLSLVTFPKPTIADVMPETVLLCRKHFFSAKRPSRYA